MGASIIMTEVMSVAWKTPMNKATLSKYLKDNYEDYYKDGDSEWRRIGAMGKVDNIISLCGGVPKGAILEIGAGEGSIIKRMSELNCGERFYAIEISSSGIDAIKRKQIPRLAECRTFDGYSIPYDNDQFDIAILSHVIEHVEHPRVLLYEASRVARYVFIEVPLEDTSRTPREFVFSKVGHINFYSPRTIRWLVQSCNLRVCRQITTNLTKEAYMFHGGYRRLANYYIKQMLLLTLPSLATKLFTYHGALVCEKNMDRR
jgi:SAM-dependent methyltransferase